MSTIAHFNNERNTNAGERMSRDDAWANWIRDTVRQFESPLLLYATRIVGSAEDAQDIVQETFLRLCAQKPESISDHLNIWLFSVCRNCALELRRKRSREAELNDPAKDAVVSPEVQVSKAAENKETLSEVMRAISKLPPSQQEVIRLKFEYGLSYREISAITELSVTNVGFMIHAGLKKVRERVAQVPKPAAVTLQ